jgi:type II secretory pathway predicted ATPase ExeA
VNSSITLGIDKKLDQAQQDRLLGALPCVEAAAFNSYHNQHERKCLRETRVDLLRQVTEWADVSSSKCIFWLNGMAGTGKSTIARTIADQFASKDRLAASFFFAKGSGDRGHARQFFSTIAVQMARALPLVETYIYEAVTEQPGIAHQTMLEQWNKLILKPLRTARDRQPLLRSIIFVIDALDECDSQEDVQLILRLLANTKDITSLKLRIFLTSRPEIPIRLGFRDMDSIIHQDLVLQDVPRSDIEHDIYLFLKHELNQIRNKRYMGPDWPNEQQLRILVEKADCLFIFAATACLFIDGAPIISPEKRLSDLVLQRTINRLSTKNLDTMYSKILQDSVMGEYTDEEKEELTEQFRRVVGSIVVLFDVLSVTALGSLLLEPSGNATQFVLGVLNSLHSVLNISEDLTQPVRLLHPSFRDFLLDPQRCPDERFWVDDKMIHQRLTEDCLRIMSQHLRKNVCELPSPGFLARDVDDDKVARCVPSYLRYACLYWVNHLREGGCDLRDNDAIHQFLQEHFLHWLEALSLMKKISDGLSMVFQLESMLMVSA